MPRIVTALFATRGEAEAARARLASTVKVESARVVGQDTAGALVGLPIEPSQLAALREALGRGDHVVLAMVARGADEAQIVDAIGSVEADEAREDGPRLSYSIGPAAEAGMPQGLLPASKRPEVAGEAAVPEPTSGAAPAISAHAQRAASAPAPAPPSAIRDAARPEVHADQRDAKEVRIGTAQVFGSGGDPHARAREFESRTPARRLTDEEVKAGGLLKDRVIEVVEMCEEPVINREVVVREEVLVRKTASERHEIVTDTVRRTEVETKDFQSPA